MKKQVVAQAVLFALSATFIVPTIWRVFRFVIMGHPIDVARVLAGILFGSILFMLTLFAIAMED